MLRPLVLGLAVATLASASWIWAADAGGDAWNLAGTILAAAGFALATWGAARDAAKVMAAGVLAAAVGIFLFYRGDFTGGTANFAGLIFLMGAGIAAAALWRGARRVAALGFVALALSGLVWIYADLDSPRWQIGDAMLALGAGVTAWGLRAASLARRADDKG